MIKRGLIYNYRQSWKKYADKHEFFTGMLNTNITGAVFGWLFNNMVKGGKTQ